MAARPAAISHLPIHWGLVAATVLVLAAIVWLRGHVPSFAEKLAPFVLPGVLDQRVEARNFTVKAKRLKLAHGAHKQLCFGALAALKRAAYIVKPV